LKWPKGLTVPLWARAIVSIALIALVLSQLHPGDAVRRLSDGEWHWFVLAIGCMLAALAIGAVRWQLFLRAAGIARSLSHAVRVYAIGAFANSFLPTGFGGDALRAWLAGTPGTRAVAAVTVVVDRATMLAMVTAFAWLAYALDPGSVPSVLVQALGGVTALVVVSGLVAVIVLRAAARSGSRLPSRAPWIADSADSARACFRGSVVWQTALLGLAYEALAVFALWLVARSISLDIAFSVLAVVVPAVLVVTAFPFSLGGLGLREGSYVVLLHQAGVSTTDAALLSLLATLLFALATLPGAFALLKRSSRRDTGLSTPTSPQELAS
jgi:glycosyltransferase 2 family protein